MRNSAVWWLIAILPLTDPVRETVERIELNHVYDRCGTKIFSQVIFWDGGQVKAWRLYRDERQRPTRDWRRGDWATTWQDGALLREVRAAAFRETWTQYDVELKERESLPAERRRELFNR